MLSEIPYGTIANYSPRGTSQLSKDSRKVCGQVKGGNVSLLDKMIGSLQEPTAAAIANFFDDETILVPVPGSAPLREGAFSAPRIICDRLLAASFGKEISPLLRRVTAVPKSAFAGAGNRPTIQVHYDSMAVDADLLPPTDIVLVDDVLTRGRTSYASAWRLHDAFPEATIKILAFIRTQGLIPDVAKIKDHATGEVKYIQATHDVDRNP